MRQFLLHLCLVSTLYGIAEGASEEATPTAISPEVDIEIVPERRWKYVPGHMARFRQMLQPFIRQAVIKAHQQYTNKHSSPYSRRWSPTEEYSESLNHRLTEAPIKPVRLAQVDTLGAVRDNGPRFPQLNVGSGFPAADNSAGEAMNSLIANNPLGAFLDATQGTSGEDYLNALQQYLETTKGKAANGDEHMTSDLESHGRSDPQGPEPQPVPRMASLSLQDDSRASQSNTETSAPADVLENAKAPPHTAPNHQAHGLLLTGGGATAGDAAENGADAAENGADAAENGADAAENGADAVENGADAAENGADAAENGADAAENGADATENGADAAGTYAIARDAADNGASSVNATDATGVEKSAGQPEPLRTRPNGPIATLDSSQGALNGAQGTSSSPDADDE